MVMACEKRWHVGVNACNQAMASWLLGQLLLMWGGH
jgi:hypothetical protein